MDVGAYHYPWLPVRLVLVDRYLSSAHMPRVTSPLLQIHGADDFIVPIKLGRQLFETAPSQSAAGIEKRFAEIPNAGHNDITLVAEAEIRKEIQAFLDRLDRHQ